MNRSPAQKRPKNASDSWHASPPTPAPSSSTDADIAVWLTRTASSPWCERQTSMTTGWPVRRPSRSSWSAVDHHGHAAFPYLFPFLSQHDPAAAHLRAALTRSGALASMHCEPSISSS